MTSPISRKHVERLKRHGWEDELIYYQLHVPDNLTGKDLGKRMRMIGLR